MNEQDWADRFSRDVDALLNEAGRMDSEPTPTEHRRALDLARTLATIDFSAESQVRQTHRRRLLNQIDAREGWQSRKGHPMRTFFWQRHPAVTLAAVVLVALLAVTLAWPGTLTAAAQGTAEFVKSLWLGEHTLVRQIDPAQERPHGPVELPLGMWIVDTEIGSFGGLAFPDVKPAVRSLTDFEEAQATTGFHLQTPANLPEGYALREIKLARLGWTPQAFLFYDGPGHDIVLVQTPVGPQDGGVSVRTGSITIATLEEVSLGGRPAAWANGQSLMWEADGISYTVGGLDLSLDEAIRIAESLE